MKSVLISIRKGYNDKIINGEKRWEGRKRIPEELDKVANTERLIEPIVFYVYEPLAGGGCGKVRYKFISYGAYKFNLKEKDEYEWVKVAQALRVSVDWAKVYFNRDKGYLIRIEQPQVFDKPKELNEFRTICKTYENGYDLEKCCECKKALFDEDGAFYGCDREITRPFQSWGYCEKLGL